MAIEGLTLRVARPDDAPTIETLLRQVFPAGCNEEAAFNVDVQIQTGRTFLVAECGASLRGAVRTWEDEGIVRFDLLASARAGAGPALVRAVERRAQDLGLRLVRANAPEGRLADWFSSLGYRPVASEHGPAGTSLVLEKRVPLLTVREQRREDAGAIGEIAGIDPWPLAQEPRPGWFVLADGDRVAGVVRVRDAGAGRAEIIEPVVRDGYRARGLELWMIERSLTYAATRGFHTAELRASPVLDAIERELEDRRWFREGAGGGSLYRKRLEDGATTFFDAG